MNRVAVLVIVTISILFILSVGYFVPGVRESFPKALGKKTFPSVTFDPNIMDKSIPPQILWSAPSVLSSLKSKVLGRDEPNTSVKKEFFEKAELLKQKVKSSRHLLKYEIEQAWKPPPDEGGKLNVISCLSCLPYNKGSVLAPFKLLDAAYLFHRLLYDDMNLSSEKESEWKKDPSKILIPVDQETYGASNKWEGSVFADLSDPEYFPPRLTSTQLSNLTASISSRLDVLNKMSGPRIESRSS